MWKISCLYQKHHRVGTMLLYYKKLDHLEADEEPDDQFLGTLEDRSATTSQWEVTLSVNGLPVLLRLILEQTRVLYQRTFSNSYIMFHSLQPILALVVQASISYKCLDSSQLSH